MPPKSNLILSYIHVKKRMSMLYNMYKYVFDHPTTSYHWICKGIAVTSESNTSELYRDVATLQIGFISYFSQLVMKLPRKVPDVENHVL